MSDGDRPVTAPLSEEALAAIEALAEAATAGPWHAKDELIWAGVGGEAVASVADWGHPAVQRDDAEFIAAARSDVPRLVAALREARRENERLRDAVSAVHERLERSDWIVACELLRLIDSAGA